VIRPDMSGPGHELTLLAATGLGGNVPGADIVGKMLPSPGIGHIARYLARRANAGLGQFLQIPFAHATALVLGFIFPTSDAMVSTACGAEPLRPRVSDRLAIELIERQ
jgi:hypothetical protein